MGLSVDLFVQPLFCLMNVLAVDTSPCEPTSWLIKHVNCKQLRVGRDNDMTVNK
jgi:hypothetical protein